MEAKGLSPKEKAHPSIGLLGCLVAALVLRREETAAGVLRELRGQGVKREMVREAILQTYLFDGYPTALEGMILLSHEWPGEVSPVEEGDYDHWRDWLARGEELYARIYGEVAERLQANAREVSPELARWMIVEGYGKVLSRGVLGVADRELINVAILAVKRRPRQLHSHLRGALRVGAFRTDVEGLLAAVGECLANPPGIAEAAELFRGITA